MNKEPAHFKDDAWDYEHSTSGRQPEEIVPCNEYNGNLPNDLNYYEEKKL